MTRYFIKIDSPEIGYCYTCFSRAYNDDHRVGNLVYRYINKTISKRESIFLDKIKFEIFIQKDTSSPNKIVSFFYDNYKPNEKMITEVDAKYVKSRKTDYKIVRYKGDIKSSSGRIYLPTFYEELRDFNNDEYFRIFISGGDYAFIRFRDEYEKKVCKIICYEQFSFEKYVDYPEFFENYEAFLKDNGIEVALEDASNVSIDYSSYYYDESKHRNYINVSFNEMYDYVNRKLPTSNNNQ